MKLNWNSNLHRRKRKSKWFFFIFKLSFIFIYSEISYCFTGYRMAPSTGKSTPMGTQTSSGSQKISTEILVGWPPTNAPPKVSRIQNNNNKWNPDGIASDASFALMRIFVAHQIYRFDFNTDHWNDLVIDMR